MSELKVNKISPRSGTDVTLGDSGDTFTLGSGANIAGLTLSDNILFDTASKGIYLGVTSATASNLLDDYEEGTWLPSFQGSSSSPSGVNFTTRAGFYRKIGTTVFISVNLNISSWSSGPTGTLRIGTLPFSTTSASNYQSVFFVGFASNFGTNDTPVSGQIPASANQIRLYKKNGSDSRSAITTNSDSSDVSGDEHIVLSGFYETD